MGKKIIRKKVPSPKNKAIKTKHGYQSKEQAKYGGTIGEASRRAFNDAMKKIKKHNVKDPY